MGATAWPTWWVVVAPAMMLAFMVVCMASTRCLMRGPYRGRDVSRRAGAGAADPAPTRPHVPARFPDGPAAFERLGTAKDKAEFGNFMARQPTRPGPPS